MSTRRAEVVADRIAAACGHEAALEELPDAVLLTDRHGTIRWANRAAAELTGRSPAALVGLSLGHLVDRAPGDLPAWDCRLATAAGQVRPVRVTAGRATRAVGARDVQDLYILREGRPAAAEYHDLRKLTHLAALALGTLRLHAEDPARRTACLGALEEVVEQMGHVLRRASGTPAPGAGRRLAMLGDLARQVVEAVTAAGAGRPVRAEGLDRPLPCRVEVEEVKRAILNVLVNAFEASPPGSPVRVAGRLDAEAGQVVLEVEDEGPGFPESVLSWSAAAGPLPSAKPGGLGLGLYQARRIVEMHAGTLRLANRPRGRGARVTVSLPAARPASPPNGGRS
jgi:signal transduction histidine kinase